MTGYSEPSRDAFPAGIGGHTVALERFVIIEVHC